MGYEEEREVYRQRLLLASQMDLARREELRKAETCKHIFLTNDNALQTIDDALGAIIVKERQEARSKAFDDCSTYWKNVVSEILKTEDDDHSAILKIMKALHI